MKRNATTISLFAFFVAFNLVAITAVMTLDEIPLRADEASQREERPQPVEDDMHEFMEYVFEPSYKRLKAQIAAEPSNKSGWKAIKSDALILSEATNLLWLREPEDNLTDWHRLASSVRDEGSHLYRAARKKNYAEARTHYANMLVMCNRCHDEFAEGEHQLQP